MWCNVERVTIDTFKCYKAEGKQFHSENSKWIWPFSKCFSEHLFSISLEVEVTLLFDFFSRPREISNVYNNVSLEGKSIFRMFSKYFPNGLWNTSFRKKIMSEGTPSLPSFVDRGRSLLKTIMFWLRVMTISECFPNKSQMNDETPLICKNISFRGALFPRGKPICLRVHLSIFIRHFDWIKWQTIVWV